MFKYDFYRDPLIISISCSFALVKQQIRNVKLRVEITVIFAVLQVLDGGEVTAQSELDLTEMGACRHEAYRE